MTDTTARQLAQQAYDLHYAVACAADPEISNYQSAYYLATDRAVDAFIASAYPEACGEGGLSVLMATRELLVDTGESVAWCVARVVSDQAEQDRQHAEAAAEEAAYWAARRCQAARAESSDGQCSQTTSEGWPLCEEHCAHPRSSLRTAAVNSMIDVCGCGARFVAGVPLVRVGRS